MAPPSSAQRCRDSGSLSETNFSGARGRGERHHRWHAQPRTGNRAGPISRSAQSARAPTKCRARLSETPPTNESKGLWEKVELIRAGVERTHNLTDSRSFF